jgi:hypothetical protein
MLNKVGFNEQVIAGWIAGTLARTITNPFGITINSKKYVSFHMI